jgi:hypothetical protein
MNLNQIRDALEEFLVSSAVKNIFDNIRNLVLSSVVLVAGNFLRTTAPISVSPRFNEVLGEMLISCGFLLMFLCTTHGYILLTKSGISIFVARIITGVYLGLSVIFFLALLSSKGITFG